MKIEAALAELLAMIRGHHDERVVPPSLPLELRKELPELVVEVGERFVVLVERRLTNFGRPVWRGEGIAQTFDQLRGSGRGIQRWSNGAGG